LPRPHELWRRQPRQSCLNGFTDYRHGLLGVTLLALARPLFDVHPALLLGAAAVLAVELRGVHPIILIGAATLLGAVTGFYIL
jgi:hypothetical protein